MTNTIQQEVDQNYDEFERLLPTILDQHRGKYALMKARKILGYYSSAEDARAAGELAIQDKIFSIQHVTDISVNLGFYNNAVLVAAL